MISKTNKLNGNKIFRILQISLGTDNNVKNEIFSLQQLSIMLYETWFHQD